MEVVRAAKALDHLDTSAVPVRPGLDPRRVLQQQLAQLAGLGRVEVTDDQAEPDVVVTDHQADPDRATDNLVELRGEFVGSFELGIAGQSPHGRWRVVLGRRSAVMCSGGVAPRANGAQGGSF